MFQKRKVEVNKDSELLENIKREIEIQLDKIGVMISGINMEIKPKNISFCIFINSCKRLARL